ncbi:hypothetical protein PLESTB_001472900 [Pleodorina starrii]|uniref:Vacuolar cation/proton exchanger n=1 Tax=Pleodorina starrii TaxID=330485 RepID=A0A9W6F845_9CHLO|nr:hypothetical protein PLESTM_000644300 [Pleodorina starrii]GLC59310.1 hypothetical protein PLESTB_001472900 [Pleodorina starrii]GLC74491.1 hypothetical protein PLESTF_001518400 [Pleodorina starrii]
MSAQRKAAISVVKAETRQRLAELDDAEEYDEALLNGYQNGANGVEGGFARVSATPSLGRGARRPSVAGGDRTLSRVSVLSAAPKWFVRDYLATKEIILSSWFNLLLVCVPLGWASAYVGWGAVTTFTLNFLALIPLALILGDITEDLAVRFGDVVGGLINATFGNVVEIMVSLFALFKDLYTVVAASLLGSILSNLLLVLGCSFFLGGLFHSVQTFNAVSNRACSSLLMLACIGVSIPSAASVILIPADLRQDWILDVSRGTAVIMLICYVCYLAFQLKTHADLFKGEDDDAVPMLTLGTSIGLLTAITAVVAVCSEFLTDSIKEVSESTHLSEAFIGLIILPIAGNACEHLTACIVAMRNKMDLSMGVAVGSSIQIALFAIPFNVVVGWISGHNFSLDFSPFAALVLLVCVVHANFVTADATSHWLLGIQLVALYCLVAVAYFYQ